MLSEQAGEKLLDIARRTVEAAVRGDLAPAFRITAPELQQHCGAFVTLKTHGHLRGCIGQFVADEPVWQVVRDMADAAATRDMRFFGNQLTPGELPDLHVEISVLSPLELTKDPMEDVELGVHGIYIRHGMQSGCFLPQVATETGWTKEEFLQHCCAGKAGLHPDAWKDPRTEIYTFTAQIIE